jgi:hypothetical protein
MVFMISAKPLVVDRAQYRQNPRQVNAKARPPKGIALWYLATAT